MHRSKLYRRWYCTVDGGGRNGRFHGEKFAGLALQVMDGDQLNQSVNRQMVLGGDEWRADAPYVFAHKTQCNKISGAWSSIGIPVIAPSHELRISFF